MSKPTLTPITVRIAGLGSARVEAEPAQATTKANGTTPTYMYLPAPGPNVPGTQIALPVYGAAYGQVDAGVTFKVNDNLSLSLQGTNIFNETQRTLMGGYKNDAIYTRSWFQSDRRVSLGANLSF